MKETHETGNNKVDYPTATEGEESACFREFNEENIPSRVGDKDTRDMD